MLIASCDRSFLSVDCNFVFVCVKIWQTNWGELYAKDMPQDYEGKIKKLENEINKLPTVRVMTLTQMSYKPLKPYDEWHNFKRKSIDRFKSVEDDKEK